METLQEVMTHATKVMVDVKNGNNMIYLPLDKIINDAQLRDENKQKSEAADAGSVSEAAVASQAPEEPIQELAPEASQQGSAYEAPKREAR